MAKTTVQLDQDKLLDRLDHLEKRLTQVGKGQGGGFGATVRTLLLGALVGGALALLYAPQQGEEARRRMLELKEQAGQRVGQVKEQIAPAADPGHDQAKASTRTPSATAAKRAGGADRPA